MLEDIFTETISWKMYTWLLYLRVTRPLIRWMAFLGMSMPRGYSKRNRQKLYGLLWPGVTSVRFYWLKYSKTLPNSRREDGDTISSERSVKEFSAIKKQNKTENVHLTISMWASSPGSCKEDSSSSKHHDLMHQPLEVEKKAFLSSFINKLLLMCLMARIGSDVPSHVSHCEKGCN